MYVYIYLGLAITLTQDNCDIILFSSEELHAEVCYAECLLQRAALTFLQVRTEAACNSICHHWYFQFVSTHSLFLFLLLLLLLSSCLSCSGWKHDQFHQRGNQSEEQLPDIQVRILKSRISLSGSSISFSSCRACVVATLSADLVFSLYLCIFPS